MGRYAIFNGLVYGGGTDVIPNPEGTPTEELHSLQIGNDIYEIVGGGGSGGSNASLDATTLYDTPITTTGTYTLADDYNNYDFIGFKAGNGSTETDIRLYAVKDIQDSMNDNLVITNNVTNSWFNFTINENELTIPGKTVSTIYSVIGYKIKGGSSGGGSQELISYDTTITTTQYGWWTAEDKDGNILDPDQYELIAVTPFVNNSPSWVGSWDGAFFINTVDGTTHRYDVTFVNINDGGYIRTSRTWDIKVVYRDKNAAGGGGGSTVVPNPQEEPTDTLNTVEIDGVVYDIEGGSEGGQGLNPANYSTEEEVIGVWTNNLPVYKKTWIFSSAITVASNSWADTSISVNDTQIHTIVNCEAVGPNGQAWTCISATTDEATQTYVRVLNTRDTHVSVKHLTLYYIKDGDSPIVPPGAKGEYNYYGGFIDTNNIIDSGTYTGTFTYIATEDCYVNVALVNNSNSDAQITIDGAIINYTWSTDGITNYQTLPLKKGQTLVATSSAGSSLDYTVYGITYASGSGGTSEGEGVEIYSEDEYIVGKWIDGKKLYQKSIKFSATSLSTNWMTIEQGVDYNLAFPEVQGLYYTSNGEPFTQSTRVFVQNGDLKIQPLNELDLLSSTLKHVITIRYTKTVETPAPAWGGSVNNYYANFIDTDNVIDSGVYNPTTPLSYTATEDCFVVIALIANNNPCIVFVDNKEIYRIYDNGIGSITVPVPIKKGQTITATTSYSAEDSPYTVYGITYASGGSDSESFKIEYSTEEKEVGTWIDGSPIYQKTIHYTHNDTIGAGYTTIASLSNIDYSEFMNCSLYNPTDKRTYALPYTYGDKTTALTCDNGDIKLRVNNDTWNANWDVVITVRYTKAVS